MILQFYFFLNYVKNKTGRTPGEHNGKNPSKLLYIYRERERESFSLKKKEGKRKEKKERREKSVT